MEAVRPTECNEVYKGDDKAADDNKDGYSANLHRDVVSVRERIGAL